MLNTPTNLILSTISTTELIDSKVISTPLLKTEPIMSTNGPLLAQSPMLFGDMSSGLKEFGSSTPFLLGINYDLTTTTSASELLTPHNISSDFDSVPSSRRSSAVSAGSEPYSMRSTMRSRQGSSASLVNQMINLEVWPEHSGYSTTTSDFQPLTLALPSTMVESFTNMGEMGQFSPSTTPPLNQAQLTSLQQETAVPGQVSYTQCITPPIVKNEQLVQLEQIGSSDIQPSKLTMTNTPIPLMVAPVSPSLTPNPENYKPNLDQFASSGVMAISNTSYVSQPTTQYVNCQQQPYQFPQVQYQQQPSYFVQHQVQQRNMISGGEYVTSIQPVMNSVMNTYQIQQNQPMMANPNVSMQSPVMNFQTPQVVVQSNVPNVVLTPIVQNPNGQYHAGYQTVELATNQPYQMPVNIQTAPTPPMPQTQVRSPEFQQKSTVNQCTCGKTFKKVNLFRSHCRNAHGFDPYAVAATAVASPSLMAPQSAMPMINTSQFEYVNSSSPLSASSVPTPIYANVSPQHPQYLQQPQYVQQPAPPQQQQQYQYQSTAPTQPVGQVVNYQPISVRPSMIYTGMTRTVPSSGGIDRERAFGCERCEKTFLRRHDLKRHMLTHMENGMKPFECSQCGVTFTRQDAMQRHIKAERCKNAKRMAKEAANK